MQAAADAAALGTVKAAPTLLPAELKARVTNLFNASFKHQGTVVTLTTSYDVAANILTVSASAPVAASLSKMVGFSDYDVGATSKATIGSKTWPVCVLVTEPTDNHTLLTKNNAQILFDKCMVQVNTLNWDAVEARDTSRIHSTNGENCFVGDIHYGDVKPPKSPTCTFFPDPHDTLTAPSTSCDYTNMVVTTSGEVLKPGTYCGGILVTKSATFQKGLYVLRDGKFQIVGDDTNVTATGATFVLVGSNAYLQFNTKGTITMSPATNSDAGQFGGFQFYFDDPDIPVGGKKKGNKKGSKSTIAGGKVTASGIFYLQGQKLIFGEGADVTINPGSIIADYILPDEGAIVRLTGSMNTSTTAEQQMRKAGAAGSGPVLVK